MLKILGWAGLLWLAFCSLVYMIEMSKDRACLSGRHGPQIKAEYEQAYRKVGAAKVAVDKAWICYTAPWIAWRNYVRGCKYLAQNDKARL